MKIIAVMFVHKYSAPVKVIAKFEDGSEEGVFDYFCDELSFNESELIGLTAKEAVQLKVEKDRAYLQN